MINWRIACVLGAALVCTPALAADKAAGAKVYRAAGCVGCHGPGGASANSAYPVLKGRDAAWLRQRLREFRSGERAGATMNAMAQLVSEQDIDNIAAWLASR